MDCINDIMINNLFVAEIIKKYDIPPLSISMVGDYIVDDRVYAIFRWKGADNLPLCVGCCSSISEDRPYADVTLSIPFSDDIGSLTDEQIRDKASRWLYEKFAS